MVGERALLVLEGKERHLVVGDLHVGLEEHLSRAGVHLPSQNLEMRSRIESLLKKTRATSLILLGDLKETVGRTTKKEEALLKELLSGLPVPVHLVRGNHDGGLPPLGMTLHPSTGMRIGDVLLLHGHAWPSPSKVDGVRWIVLCHSHPALLIRDSLGALTKEPCFLVGPLAWGAERRYPGLSRFAKLLVLPAFHPLLTGSPLNGDRKPQGPLLQSSFLDRSKARIYTLEGVDLGTLDELWVDVRE